MESFSGFEFFPLSLPGMKFGTKIPNIYKCVCVCAEYASLQITICYNAIRCSCAVSAHSDDHDTFNLNMHLIDDFPTETDCIHFRVFKAFTTVWNIHSLYDISA